MPLQEFQLQNYMEKIIRWPCYNHAFEGVPTRWPDDNPVWALPTHFLFQAVHGHTKRDKEEKGGGVRSDKEMVSFKQEHSAGVCVTQDGKREEM